MTEQDVEWALEINKYVHDRCKGVPHDIGMKIVEQFRLEGWLHLDDVVEGRTVGGVCGLGDYRYDCNRGLCIKCQDHISERRATVRDLIERKG